MHTLHYLFSHPHEQMLAQLINRLLLPCFPVLLLTTQEGQEDGDDVSQPMELRSGDQSESRHPFVSDKIRYTIRTQSEAFHLYMSVSGAQAYMRFSRIGGTVNHH